MTQSKEEAVQKLASSFSANAKQAAGEEVAVKQAIQKIVQGFSAPSNQRSLLETLPVEAIHGIIRKGHLTLVAQELDDNFLRSVETLVQNNSTVFEAYNYNVSDPKRPNYQKEPISKVYKQARNDLRREKKIKEPAFHDVLMRMYTDDGPFYKKMNAIVGGYHENPAVADKTSEDEIKLALLLNVAIHKAGLKKKSLEFQTTPDELFRGQSFGLENFVKKAEQLETWHKEGKLDKLTPEEIAEVNIVDVAAKKVMSATANLETAAEFAKETGVVVHIKNPEAVADFYTVANVSKFTNEAEYVSRIPDDIAMLPVNLYNKDGVTHVEVICIRSEGLLLQNTSLYKEKREALHALVSEVSEKIRKENNFGWFLTGDAKDQVEALKIISSIISLPEAELTGLPEAEQNALMDKGYTALKALYKTNPNQEQIEQFNAINNKLQEFSGILADLNVVHGIHDVAKNMQHAKNTLSSYVNGIKSWVEKDGKDILLDPVKTDLERLVALNAKDPSDPAVISEIQAIAEKISTELATNTTLKQSLPGLQERMGNIIDTVKELEALQKLKMTTPATNASEQVKSISSSQKYKEQVAGIKNEQVAKMTPEDQPAPNAPKL